MSRKSRYILALLAAAAIWSWPVAAPRADVTGRPHDLNLDNPRGHCINCHDLHQTGLGEGYEHNLKRSNEMEVCYQCHAGSMNDYSSIDPTMPARTSLYSYYDIRGEFDQQYTHFPTYGMDGEHNKCSQCHNPHGVFDPTSTTRRPKLLTAGPDAVTDTDEYCFVCHNSDANPPHSKFPNISVGSRYRISRDVYREMTHSTFFRATTITEPVPDTSLTYDDNPYGQDNDISCLTCHRPHGSPNEHMLKAADNQDFCLSCHNGSKAASLTPYTTSGHGKAGIRRICQECHFPHGTGQENAVKTAITDPHTGSDKGAFVNASGMNMACFACHGSASSVKYYPGKAAYTAGIHNTVTGIRNHNPSDAAGDQRAGECDNCHNPHGKGYGKMTVDLNQDLCYDCHNAATHNTGSGEDVKAAFQMNSHHDLSKVKCVNCHNAHRATQTSVMMNPFKPQSTITDKKSFCLKCHSGTMPSGVTGAYNVYSTWNNNGHDKTHALACSDCHESHGSYNSKNLNYHTVVYNNVSARFRTGTAYGSRAYCELCHNRTGTGYKGAKKIPVGASYVGQHDLADLTPCNSCHNKKHNPTLGAGYYTSSCLNCHKLGAGNPLPYPDTDFNTPTVSGDLNAYTSIHDITYSPPATVDCAKCHGSNHEVDHRATNKLKDPDSANGNTNMSSIRTNSVFCLECHDSTPVTIAGRSPSNINSVWTNGGHDKTHVMVCADCHEPHRSLNKYLLNYGTKVYGGYSAKFRPGASASGRALCELCHNRTGAGYKGAKVIPVGALYVGQHEQTDTTPCADCHKKKHNPRLSSYTGSSTYYTTRCLDCHTTGKGNPYPDPDADLNTPGNAGDVNTMRSVHDVTYSPPTTADCTACHGSNHESDHRPTNKLKDPDSANGYTNMSSIRVNNVFCLECHDANPVSIGGKTALNILDVYTASGHGTALAGRMLCYTCHEYHGAANEKLLKSQVSGSPVLSAYSGNNVSVCTPCHLGTSNRTPQWSGWSVYSGSIHAYGNQTTGNLVTDGRHGAGACVNCHNPHGARENGKLTGNMLFKKDENLCYTCHASGFDNFSTAGDYNNKWNKFGSVLSVKKENKALHFGQAGGQSIAQNVAVWDGLISSNSFPDKDSVITVRLKVPVYSFYAGTFQAGMKIEDPRTASDASSSATTYASLFYRMHSSPAAWICRYTGDSGATGPSAFGDEATTYHTLKVVRRASTGQFDAYVDNTFITTGNLVTSGQLKVRLFCNIGGNTSATPQTIEAWFDDFKVEYSGDGSVHNSESGDDVQERFYMKTHHGISDSDQLGADGVSGTSDDSKLECEDCHDPHTITKRQMAFKDISDISGVRVVPESADQAFCIKCHSSSPPFGVKYPEEGVWDKSMYLESAHGNTLKRDRAFGNYSNGVTYPCKVCHHPHGSDQAAQQRESWDIDRDGVPDDIDGDGVLDSTDMVGFIGYSTGTRKPLLVNMTSGIPSRSGFKRISSTIPYQENGTIDVEVCFNCHDGTPAPDVEVFFYKRSHHAVTYADQTEGGGSKIECYTCHDQHRAQARDDAKGEYATTNPEGEREPMPGDAPFCLRCHDNTLPAGVSFGNKTGTHRLKNIKLSYNPTDRRDASGYDRLTTYIGHYVQSGGMPMMCRDCHNQHGSDYTKMLRDNTEPGKPNHDATLQVQKMQPVTLRQTDPMGGSDDLPVTSTTEHCLACHSGVTTYKGNLVPLPPPPDSAERGFSMSPVGKHPDLKESVTQADETGGHIYKDVFATVTTLGSVKEDCTQCHDSHNPYIATVGGELMDCYQCHNMNTSLPDVQSEFNDNPIYPTYSRSIHPVKYDPSGSTPAYVECLKCHDQTKHMQGTVRLRKDPSSFINYTADSGVWVDPVSVRSQDANSFCLECHGPGTAVASSFWRGGTEHVPPKLPAGYDNGAHYVNGGLLCTDCHEYHASKSSLGLKKKTLPGDEEAFCYNCHISPANSNNGVNIKAKFVGSASHHQVDQAEQDASGSKVECEDCHNPHTVTRTNPVVSASDKATPVAPGDAFCIACHDSNGAKGVKFPGFAAGTSSQEWNTATGYWNRWNKTAYMNHSSAHYTDAGFGCGKCHDSHGGSNYALLLTNVSSASSVSVQFGVHSTARGKRKNEEIGINGFCSPCHKAAMGLYDGFASYTSKSFGRKLGIDKNCTYCHNPHGSAQPSMIRASKPLYMSMTSAMYGSVYNYKGFTNSTTGKPYYSFCSSRNCHKSTSEGSTFDTFNLDSNTVDTYAPGETTTSHHPIKEGLISCVSCHKEHGSSDQPDLRAPYWRSSNWPTAWHSGTGMYTLASSPRSLTYRPHGYVASYMYTYDPATFSSTKNIWQYTRGNWSRVQNPTTTPSNANDLCFMCHQKDDITGTTFKGMTGANTNFRGHEAVKGGARCSQDISRKGNGLGSDYHNFSCSACHYSHSSRKGKLMRHSCFSQNDGKTPYDNSYSYSYSAAIIFNCHPYKSWTNWVNKGWRNALMSPQKTDFTRPPNPVTDLRVDSVDQSQLTVTLKWTAVMDPDSPLTGHKADHYNVYRSTQVITQDTMQNASRIVKGASASGGDVGSTMSFTDDTCQPNSTYYYAVVAADAENNESFVSNCVPEGGQAMGNDTLPPNPVPDQTLSQGTAGSRSVTITWHDPGDNVNTAKYNIYRNDTSVPLTNADRTSGNLITGTSVTDTKQGSNGAGYPTDGTTYTYTDTLSGQSLERNYAYSVVALDATNNVSDVATGATRVIFVADPAPASVTLSSVKPVTNQMKSTITWSQPTNDGTIQGYHVYRKSGSAVTQTDLVPAFRIMSSVSGLTATDNAVPATATSYYYAVTAIDQSSGKVSLLGNSLYVNIPAPPSNVTTRKLSNSVVQVTWTAPSVVTSLSSYKVYKRKDGGAWTLAATVTYPTAVSNIDLSGQAPGQYDFAVTANYSTYGGTSNYESITSTASQAVSITDTEEPSSIASVTGALTSSSNYTKAKLDWTSPSDRNYTGYTGEGVYFYMVDTSYDQGSTWKNLVRSNLSDPNFDTFTGTADDATADTFTYWPASNTSVYAVTDSPCDGKAMKIKYTGSGDRYISANDTTTVASVANMTYSVSFWAKANKSTTFQFFIQENGGNYEWAGTTSPSIGTEWQRFSASGTFSGSAFATSTKVVIRPSSDTTAEIYIDAVRLEQGAGATANDDGTCFQPSGYDTAGNPQTFYDWNVLSPGGSVKYRVKSVDRQMNHSSYTTSNLIYTKPTAVSDLKAAPSATASANVVSYSVPDTLSGVATYNMYAKKQAAPFTNISGATLIATFSPSASSRNKGSNIASEATAAASVNTSTAGNVKDNNSTTYWAGTAGTTPETVTLTFPSAVTMNKVSFIFYLTASNTPKDYLVQTYNGSSWVTQVTVTANSSQNVTHVFPAAVTATQVRIYVTDTGGGMSVNPPYIYEFKVYPGESYVHELQNTALHAEPGETYAYAVTATDINALVSDVSSGTTTYCTVPDRTAPDKVTDLEVTSPIGTTQVQLKWTKPMDNLGHGTSTGATAYEIYRLPTSSVGTPAAVTDDNYTSGSLVDTGTYPAMSNYTTSYNTTWYDRKTVYYAVRSSDASGNWSLISNSPSVCVGVDSVAPTPPVITECTPSTSPDMVVYWLPAVDNVPNGVNGYKLFRARADLEPFLSAGCITEDTVDVADVALGSIPYNYVAAVDSGGIPGLRYYYALKAWDDENNMSNISNCVSATVRTTAADTTLPTWGVNALTVDQGPHPDIDLYWTSATDKDNSGADGSIDHYEVYRSLQSFSSTGESGVSNIATVAGIRNSYVDTTGVHDTAYYYRMVAVDASGNHNRSALSNDGSATVASPPPSDNVPPSVPGGLTVGTGVYPKLNLSWTASTDVDDVGGPQPLMYYKLYRSEYPLDIDDTNKNDAGHVRTTLMAHDAVSYEDRGMGDQKYNYRLEAVDMAGNVSGLSNQVMGQVAPAPCVDSTPPTAPASLSASVGPSPDMGLTWTASTDSGGCSGVIDHYLLYKDTGTITSATDLRTLTPVYIPGNTTSHTDSSGKANTTYYYVLTSVDSAGNESGKSNIIVKTTAADIMAPAAVSDLKAHPMSQALQLTWCRPSDNVGIDHYEIYRKAQATILTDGDIIGTYKVGDFTNLGACLTYNDTGLTGDTAYSYAVIAVDGANNRSTISRGITTGDTVATTLP